MNIRIIGKYLAFLVWAEAVFLLPAALVSLYYGGEGHVVRATLQASLACAALGLALFAACRKTAGNIYAREGFVVAGLGWVLVSLLGALPFFLSGEIPHFGDAFLESVAGFTTTGTFVQQDIEHWTRGLLFWRNFTQWLGGIGVLTFVLSIVRSRRGAGLHMFKAESPGPQVGRVVPKMQDSVRSIYIVYLGLSLICLIMLLLGGMPVFDAFCTMFGTAGTGGFGVRADSMASYSPYLQGVCTAFMLLFGTNFALYHLLLHRQWRQVLRDEELRLYLGIILASLAVVCLSLVVSGHYSMGAGLHNSSFMVASVMTSTGLSITDYSHWPALARAVLFVLMIIGSMGGSTGGGFKVARVVILFKSLRGGLYRMLHPRRVTTVQMNGKPLNDDDITRMQVFMGLYCCVVLGAFLLISVDGLPLENNLTAVIACINNVGPGFGLMSSVTHFGDYSLFSRMILAVCMLVGRLEIFPILFLFFPSTWKRKA